ncbi:hypothetical protein NESM_000165100 [Novymonas esmeraldas]|uniref:Uncharacterized protein n=1 Tax=Novymonas esmeraldas TaxID=1808958 RepID=A0AAW0F5V1_9TRYP
MKTLDQWLEDSSSASSSDGADREPLAVGGDGEPASTSDGGRSTASRAVSGSRHSGGGTSVSGSLVSAHTPVTLRPDGHPPGGLYGRQGETREKMMRLLGPDAVAKSTPSTSSVASPGSPAWPIAAAPDRSHFSFAAPVSAQPATRSSHVPAVQEDGGPAGGTPVSSTGAPIRRHTAAARTDTATESSQLPEIEKTMQGLNGDVSYEAVEVMVVDRGTQTVSTVGTQTDPLPMPYGAYYYSGPYAPSPYSGAGAYGGWMPPRPPPFGCGIDRASGPPSRQRGDDALEQGEAREAAKLRAELELIQNSIDMLIARYNLPPPPT